VEGDCLVQMKQLKNYYEKKRERMNKIGEKFGDILVKPWVGQGGQWYVTVSERKGRSSGRGITGNQIETNRSLGRKEDYLPAGNNAGDEGFLKLIMEGALNMQPLKNI
jgi:intein-encoded DNA endonuclease-like protein